MDDGYDIEYVEEIVDEADQYVRDHLLIEWMLYRFTKREGGGSEFTRLPVEQIFEEWTEWLKK